MLQVKRDNRKKENKESMMRSVGGVEIQKDQECSLSGGPSIPVRS